MSNNEGYECRTTPDDIRAIREGDKSKNFTYVKKLT